MSITHVDNLNSIKKLNELGFEGVDVKLYISLGEYGLAWKVLEEGKYLFIYRIYLNSEENANKVRFDRVVLEEKHFDSDFSWVDEKDVRSYCDTWDDQTYPDKVFTLFMYYGFENVFGSSYWEGFEIQGLEV
jgi:hypothetical protein